MLSETKAAIDAKRADTAAHFLILLLTLAAAIILGVATFGLGFRKFPFAQVLGLHVICAALCAAAAYADRNNRAVAGSAALAAAWIAIGGAFGAVIASLSLAARLLFPRTLAPIPLETGLASFDEPQPRVSELHHALADGRLRIEGAHAVTPLIDTFRHGVQSEKLNALAVLARRFTPDLAPGLHIALADRDSAVRVLATSVLTHLDSQHGRQIKDRRALLDDAQGDSAALSAAWLSLAEAHQSYAQSGLLKAGAQRGEWLKALQCAQSAIDAAAGQNNAARIAAATILLELERGAEAERYLLEPFGDSALEAKAQRLRALAARSTVSIGSAAQ